MQALLVQNPAASMLLPISLVAQILAHEELAASTRKAAFVVGEIQWRQFQVPVIDTGALFAAAAATAAADVAPSGARRSQQRVVVIWPMKGGDSNDFLAFISRTSPRVVGMAGITAAAMKPPNYALGAAELENGAAFIPDLERIAQQVFARA